MRAQHNPFPPAEGAEGDLGLTALRLVVSVWNVWHACQAGKDLASGETLPDWVETHDDYRYGWERGIGSTTPAIEGADGTPWSTLSRQLHENVQAAIADGAGYRAWDQLGSAERLLWEACVRHLTNLLHWVEGDEAVEDFEERMRLWFQEKLQARGLSHGSVSDATRLSGGRGLLAA